MKAPNVGTQNGEIRVPELPVVGTAGNIDYRRMTPKQLEKSIQRNISNNVQTQPEVVQQALWQGMSALINIETRLRTESRNANYSGFNVDASQTAYMDFQTAEGSVKGSSTKLAKLVTAAEAMAADIKVAFKTGQLTKAEAGKLHGVLTEIVGDTELAQVHMADAVDGEVESGYNKKETVNLSSHTLETAWNNIVDFIAGNKDFNDVIEDYAKVYSDFVNSNRIWRWDRDILGGEGLTRYQKECGY